MTTAQTGSVQRISLGRTILPVALGGLLVIVGLAGYLSMRPQVISGSLNNGPMMGTALGLWFFVGLALMAYGMLIARYN